MAREIQLSGFGHADWICIHCGHVGLMWFTQDQQSQSIMELRLTSISITAIYLDLQSNQPSFDTIFADHIMEHINYIIITFFPHCSCDIIECISMELVQPPYTWHSIL